jgi:tetratricopeptide (TPR) repeat protein
LTFYPEFWIRKERSLLQDLTRFGIKGYLEARRFPYPIPRFLQEGLLLYGADLRDPLTSQFLIASFDSSKPSPPSFPLPEVDSFLAIHSLLFFEFLKQDYGVARLKQFISTFGQDPSWEKLVLSVFQEPAFTLLQKFETFQHSYFTQLTQEPARLYLQALQVFAEKKYPEAQALFQQLLEGYSLSYLHAVATYYQGKCFYQQERFSEAEGSFQRLIEAYAPFSIHLEDASFLKALCAFKLGNTDSASHQLEAFQRDFGENALKEVWYWRGLLFLEKQEDSTAEACFQKAIDSTNRAVPALEQLAKLKQKQEKWQAALHYYEKIRELQPDFQIPDTFYNTSTRPLSEVEIQKLKNSSIQVKITPLDKNSSKWDTAFFP